MTGFGRVNSGGTSPEWVFSDCTSVQGKVDLYSEQYVHPNLALIRISVVKKRL